MSNDEMNTKPTIDTILERLDEWGTRFKIEFSGIHEGQDSLRKSIEELRNGQGELRQSVEELRNSQEDLRKGQEALRTDLNTGLRRIERKIEILNDNLLTINADIRDLEVRLEKLESASELKG